jgi:site-specific recombinase XerD
MPAHNKTWPIGQCPVCLGWGEKRQCTACPGCAKWRRAFPSQKPCLRCAHLHHVNGDGLCRACSQLLRHDDPDWIFHRTPGQPVQLTLIIPGIRPPRAAPLLLPARRKRPSTAPEHSLRDAVVTRNRWHWWLAASSTERQISPHLINPAQTTLFDIRRDWSCLAVGELDELPALTPEAHALLEEFQRHARRNGWNTTPRVMGATTLKILLAWVGAAAPIHEADIRALAARRGTTIRRVLQFLQTMGMVIPDPDRHGDPVERTLQRRISALPDRIAEELRRWVLVLRGQGRRPHAEFPFTTIRTYYNSLSPILTLWTSHVASLREITPADIEAALDAQPPTTARNLLSALNSLFRALKQERLIFRDPTRGISLTAIRRLPTPIPTDQLRGLIDRPDGVMAKLVVALIAIHALGKKETEHLLLADLDLQAGRLRLTRHGTQRHTVYLDGTTHALAVEWLQQRRRLWPHTTNPHLLVSQITAADPTHPPIAHTITDALFQRLGISPGRLRRDRILDEAHHTADPVHLMRIFGIGAKAAMTYIQAAHPERRATVPR